MINEKINENEKEKENEKLEKIRRHAKYLAGKLYGIRFFNAKEVRKLFRKEILLLLQKEDVNYTIYFITGEQGLMELINLGIKYGFSFMRWDGGQRYNILPELERLVNNRYNGYKYFLEHYNDYSGEDLERIDERNYATGLNEVEISIYKSHLDPILTQKDIVIRFIDYIDYETLL